MVFPDFAVLIRKPVLLLGQPVWRIVARLGHQIYFKPRLFENIEGVKGLSDEDTWEYMCQSSRLPKMFERCYRNANLSLCLQDIMARGPR